MGWAIDTTPKRAGAVSLGLVAAVAGVLLIVQTFGTGIQKPDLADPVPIAPMNDQMRSVFVGQGCFWHTQYDVVVMEQQVGGVFGQRSNADVTALVGYAGSMQQGPGGAVCYHGDIAKDYSKMGHGEAVSVQLDYPAGEPIAPDATTHAQFQQVIAFFFEHGYSTVANGLRQRLDPGDYGGEYRSMIGIPGGVAGPLYADVKAANKYNMTLQAGSGGHADFEGEFVVYIYDSDRYPFYRAEKYHQFHTNDVLGRPVPSTYTVDLKIAQSMEGRMDPTGCSESQLGVQLLPLVWAALGTACIIAGLYLVWVNGQALYVHRGGDKAASNVEDLRLTQTSVV
jgi:peptide methionine sulfoxide reductase MsrA